MVETGWLSDREWQEGDWIGTGRQRKIGEKKGGVGLIMKMKNGRRSCEVEKETEKK